MILEPQPISFGRRFKRPKNTRKAALVVNFCDAEPAGRKGILTAPEIAERIQQMHTDLGAGSRRSCAWLYKLCNSVLKARSR